MFHRICREFAVSLFKNSFLKTNYKFLEVFNFKFIVKFYALGFFNILDDSLKRIDILFVYRLHTQYYVTIHLYETTICIVSETRIICFASQSLNNFIIQTKVQDSIHHTWH
ncbi:uncharacterized protein BN805_01653 [Prevotella sp. CAG:891]|nr:uncharacterized protein BN805_01653 [Prevotella sp. CAG:891]